MGETVKAERTPKLTIRPVTAARWGDVEKLFGPRGACGGCWCMWWRIPRSEFVERKGDGNRNTLRKLIKSGDTPGVLAYVNGQPIGWCSIGPRDAFPVLDRSRVLKRIDEAAVWSVVCFFVAKPLRRQGVTTSLLRAAVKYAKTEGARIVEGYPMDPKTHAYPDIFAFTGLISTFRTVGFVEVARRARGRPIMRYIIKTPNITARKVAPGKDQTTQ